jgi:hypothetical protein
MYRQDDFVYLKDVASIDRLHPDGYPLDVDLVDSVSTWTDRYKPSTSTTRIYIEAYNVSRWG